MDNFFIRTKLKLISENKVLFKKKMNKFKNYFHL